MSTIIGPGCDGTIATRWSGFCEAMTCPLAKSISTQARASNVGGGGSGACGTIGTGSAEGLGGNCAEGLGRNSPRALLAKIRQHLGEP